MNNLHLIGLSGRMHSGKDTVADIIRYLSWEQGREKAVGFRYLSDAAIASELGSPRLLQHLDECCSWRIKRFAGKLKQIATLLTGIPVEKFEDQAFKETFLGPEWDLWGVSRDEGAHGPCQWFGTLAELKASRLFTHYGSAANHKIMIDARPFIVRRKRTVRSFLQDLGTNSLRDVMHPEVHINAMFSDWTVKVLPQNREGGLDVMTFVPVEHWLATDVRFPNEQTAIKARDGIVIRIVRPGHETGNTHFSETALDGAVFDELLINDGTLEQLVGKVREILIRRGVLEAHAVPVV